MRRYIVALALLILLLPAMTLTVAQPSEQEDRFDSFSDPFDNLFGDAPFFNNQSDFDRQVRQGQDAANQTNRSDDDSDDTRNNTNATNRTNDTWNFNDKVTDDLREQINDSGFVGVNILFAHDGNATTIIDRINATGVEIISVEEAEAPEDGTYRTEIHAAATPQHILAVQDMDAVISIDHQPLPDEGLIPPTATVQVTDRDNRSRLDYPTDGRIFRVDPRQDAFVVEVIRAQETAGGDVHIESAEALLDGADSELRVYVTFYDRSPCQAEIPQVERRAAQQATVQTGEDLRDNVSAEDVLFHARSVTDYSLCDPAMETYQYEEAEQP